MCLWKQEYVFQPRNGLIMTTVQLPLSALAAAIMKLSGAPMPGRMPSATPVLPADLVGLINCV